MRYELRPYQVAMLDAIASAHKAGANRLLCRAATGLGKTVSFSMLPHRLRDFLNQFPETQRKMLVIAHREELLDQAAEKLRAANPGLMVMVEQGDRVASVYADIIVASIQTLSSTKFRRLHRLTDRITFRIVVVDECFPAGTLVDGRAIETLRVGDMVTAVDPETGYISAKRVLWTGCKRAPGLLTIVMADGRRVTCTPNHRVWTQLGWMRADSLQSCDSIASITETPHAHTSSSDLLQMQGAGHAHGQIKDRLIQSFRQDLLLGRVQRHYGAGGFVSAYGRHESQVRVSQDEGQQSDEAQVGSSKDVGHSQGDGLDAEGAWRQRHVAAIDTASAGSGSWVAYRGGNQDWTSRENSGQLPDELQVRHRERRFEGGRRSGRKQSLLTATSGREEGRFLSWARVDHLEVHEPGSDGRFGGLCRDGLVYDIEVEDYHTFVVEGLVVSNCHHAAASTYRTALSILGFLPPNDASEKANTESATDDEIAQLTKNLQGWDQRAPQDRLLVGVTATPNRSDAIGLGCVFQSIAYSYALKEAIADKWLVPMVSWTIETKTSLEEVRISRGDFNQKDLAAAVNEDKRNLMALAAWQQYALGRPTIGFTVDVAHAHAMQDVFRTAGIRAQALSGETPKEDRRQMLRAYTEGGIDVLFNCMVLTEGTDLPRTSCILHLKPTKSATLYEQMTGRGLRLFPDKTECVVIDLVDVSRRHSLQSAPSLYGLPPTLSVKGKKLNDVAEAVDALLQVPGFDLERALSRGRLTLEQLQAHAKQVDIWNIPSLGAFGSGRAMNWTKVGEERYRLQYPWADGTETIEVSPDLLGKWDIVLTMRPSDSKQPKRQKTMAAEIETSDAAAALAEVFILQERRSVVKLKDKDAPWRSRPCTEKQRAMLHRLGVQVIPANCTMGQASDQIDQRLAQKGR